MRMTDDPEEGEEGEDADADEKEEHVNRRDVGEADEDTTGALPEMTTAIGQRATLHRISFRRLQW